jgi:hypothetical protein
VLTFAVVASRSGRPLDPSKLEEFDTRAAGQLPFPTDQHLTWTNDSGTVWFTGWQAPGRGGAHLEARWHLDGDGVTAFAGRVWPRRDGWRGTLPVALQLAHHLRRQPLVSHSDELAGVYAVASLSSGGTSSIATDPVSTALMYVARTTDVVILSTRASVAAAILAAVTGAAPRRDLWGVGWLAYAGFPMGLRTGFEGVSLVPDGSLVEIDRTGAVELQRSTRAPWRCHVAELAADPHAALETVRAEMTTALRTVLRDPCTQGCLGLTGGKDSRLILALLLAEGLADSIECQTLGSHDLPDVVAARQLAASFGLRHVTTPGREDRWAWRQRVDEAVRERGLTDCPSREIAFRLTAWSASGLCNSAEPHLGRLPPHDSVLLSGLFGESLRTDYPGTSRMRSKHEAARFPDNQNMGSTAVLVPDAMAAYRAELHGLLFEGATDEDTPQDVIDTFYLRQRVRHWVGSTVEVDGENRAFPLYSITGLRLAFAIGAPARHASWIHYRLMRDACEPLVHLPFATGAWPAGSDRDPVRPARHSDAIPARPPGRGSATAVGMRRRLAAVRGVPGPRTVAREYRASVQQSDREIMRRLFRHDPTNPAFELIDSRSALRAVDCFEALTEPQRVQVYGALNAVIWLGGYDVALPLNLTVV